MTDPTPTTDVTIEQLAADFETFRGHVAPIVAANALLQQELADALANAGNVIPAALQTAINNLDGAVKTADAALTTPAPEPIPEPAPEPTPEG